jgi:predicted nucleotide-binding protein/phosphoglycolate phosphatase-like HAD superfamily hydrolase
MVLRNSEAFSHSPGSSSWIPGLNRGGLIGREIQSSTQSHKHLEAYNMARPKIFIGSSTEALSLARVVELHLSESCDTTLWRNGVFGLSRSAMESLEKALDDHEFALLILTPDDKVTSRGKKSSRPRDNTLFELGLFVGRLGRDRTFIVCDPKVTKIPSDLLGITVAPFDWQRAERLDDVRSALSPACTEVLQAIGTARSSPFALGPRVVQTTDMDFVEQLDLAQIEELDILCHTGRSLFHSIRQRLEKLGAPRANQPERIRVLTRAPFAESPSRNRYIAATVTQVQALQERGLDIDIRFYESIAAIRGVLCKSQDGTWTGFTSGYGWPEPNKSKAWDYGFVLKQDPGQERAENALIQRWFEHCWGRDEIHTVVFDFDDTLVSTGDIQIKAWVQAISQSIENEWLLQDKLCPQLRSLASDCKSLGEDPRTYEVVKDVFIRRQLAEAIAQDLFVNLSDQDLRRINQVRFRIRRDLMPEATVFDGLAQLLPAIQDRYNFALISSTDERMIAEELRKRDLLHHFPIILGKNDASLRDEKVNIHKKSWLLIKLSELIGMPLTRLVYIGDNDTDWLAARQLGVAFIEARQAAIRLGQKSLLATRDFDRCYIGSFTSFEDGSLPELLRRHSETLACEKFNLDRHAE